MTVRSTSRGGRSEFSPRPVQQDMLLGEAEDPTGEYVKTPAWLAAVMLDAVAPFLPRPPEGCRLSVLDAGAGIGVLAAAVQERWPCTMVTAVELYAKRAEPTAVHPGWPAEWRRVFGDLVEWATDVAGSTERFDLVVTNPPFSRWFEWTGLLQQLVAADGVLASLSPAEYLSRDVLWWNSQKPHLHVVTDRRPWRAVREVAWSVWAGDHGAEWTELRRVDGR